MRTRITPNTDTFYAVAVLWKYWAQFMQNHCNWIKVYRQHESLVFGNLKSIWYDYCKGYHIIRFVGNKIKGWISKRVLQENKARQIFQKTNNSYQGDENQGDKKCFFFGKFGVLCFLVTSDLKFVILPCYWWKIQLVTSDLKFVILPFYWWKIQLFAKKLTI